MNDYDKVKQYVKDKLRSVELRLIDFQKELPEADNELEIANLLGQLDVLRKLFDYIEYLER